MGAGGWRRIESAAAGGFSVRFRGLGLFNGGLEKLVDEKSCKDACYGDPRCGVWQFNINQNEPSRGPETLEVLKTGWF